MGGFDRLLVIAMAALFAVFGVIGIVEHRRTTSNFSRTNRAALIHLCSLQNITQAVWRSAAMSYASLPNRTPDQTRLLVELEAGLARIRADHICPVLLKGVSP